MRSLTPRERLRDAQISDAISQFCADLFVERKVVLSMAFSPVFLLASVFRLAVGRRQRVHPFSQDHDTDDALPADTRGNVRTSNITS